MTKSTIKAIPDGMHSLTPYLICADAANAIKFYKTAFDSVELSSTPGAQGKLVNASIRIGNSMLMLMDELPSGADSDRSRSRARLSPSTCRSKMSAPSLRRPLLPAQKSRCRSRTNSGATGSLRWKTRSTINGR